MFLQGYTYEYLHNVKDGEYLGITPKGRTVDSFRQKESKTLLELEKRGLASFGLSIDPNFQHVDDHMAFVVLNMLPPFAKFNLLTGSCENRKILIAKNLSSLKH